MDFAEYLKSTAKEIDKEVGKILEEQLKEAEKTDKKLVPLMKAFAKACQGGKGIRGVLVALGYQIGRKSSVVSRQSSDNLSLKAESEAILKTDSSIIQIAAAYEILHSAILIHDDVIDQSSTRRDKPALYKELGNNHYGISQAISLGDYGFFLVFKIIAGTNFPEGSKIRALELFSKVMMDTTWGEMLDLEDTDPLIVMKLKTARYSIAGPLQIGAVLTGADEKLTKALGEFGENLGIAYQIRDDILDGDAGTPEKAEKYIKKAMNMLPEITKDKKMSKILEQMGEYLVQRTK